MNTHAASNVELSYRAGWASLPELVLLGVSNIELSCTYKMLCTCKTWAAAALSEHALPSSASPEGDKDGTWKDATQVLLDVLAVRPQSRRLTEAYADLGVDELSAVCGALAVGYPMLNKLKVYCQGGITSLDAFRFLPIGMSHICLRYITAAKVDLDILNKFCNLETLQLRCSWDINTEGPKQAVLVGDLQLPHLQMLHIAFMTIEDKVYLPDLTLTFIPASCKVTLGCTDLQPWVTHPCLTRVCGFDTTTDDSTDWSIFSEVLL